MDSGVDIDDVRFGNVVHCRSISADGNNRNPTLEEIDSCRRNVLDDIQRTQPEVILVCGNSALQGFRPGWEGPVYQAINRSLSENWKFEGIPYRVIYHPSYIHRQGGKSNQVRWNRYLADISAATKQTRSVPGDEDDLSITVFKLDQLDEFLEMFEGEEQIGYDLEASSLQTMSPYFIIAGIGLSTLTKSAYLQINDFWSQRTLSPQEKSAIAQFLVRAQDRGLLVFNLKYEVPATFNAFGVELMNVTDVMQESVTLHVRGSLKNLSREYLGETRWSDEVETWIEQINGCLKYLKPTTRYTKSEEKILREDGAFAIMVHLGSEGDPFRCDPSRNQREHKLHAHLARTFKILGALSDESEKIDLTLTALLKKHLDNRIYEARYSEIPSEISAPYCCRDAWNTRRLHDHFQGKLNTPELQTAFQYYNEQAYLGYELELNGIAWDDEFAGSLHETYETLEKKALKELILHPKLARALELSSVDQMKIQASTSIDELKKYFNPNSSHPKSGVKEKMTQAVVTGKLRLAMALSAIEGENLSDVDLEVAYPHLSWLLKKKASPSDCLNYLLSKKAKMVAPKNLLWYSIVGNLNEDDREGYINQLIKDLDQAQSLDDVRMDYPITIPLLEKRTFSTRSLAKIEKLSANIATVWDKLSYSERRILGEYSRWVISSMDLNTVEEIYSAMVKFLGVNPDDPDSLIDEMVLLTKFRTFKKIAKCRSSYIAGAVGRGSVWMVDKEQFQSGNRKCLRLAQYTERSIKANEAYVFYPKYNVNGAETKRWKSGHHTIPWNSELRELQIPRFRDGLMMYWDYAQMEIRVMAVMARENSLIEAFESGMDVHRFIASKIFKKPPEQIRDSERRFSKIAVFSILYGKSVEGVANDFMGGSMKEAKQLFDSVFGQFPNILTYVKDTHKMVKENQQVHTIWGDPINMSFDPTDKGALTQAQRQGTNYRIQGSASNITAACINQVRQEIVKNGFRAKPYAFTHDSANLDVPPQEVLPICHSIPILAERYPLEKWNIPAKVDLEIGLNGSQTLKLSRLEGQTSYTSKGNGRIHLHCNYSGREGVVDEVARRLKLHCEDVNIEVTNKAEAYLSNEELYQHMRAYTKDIGTIYHKEEGILSAVQLLKDH